MIKCPFSSLLVSKIEKPVMASTVSSTFLIKITNIFIFSYINAIALEIFYFSFLKLMKIIIHSLIVESWIFFCSRLLLVCPITPLRQMPSNIVMKISVDLAVWRQIPSNKVMKISVDLAVWRQDAWRSVFQSGSRVQRRPQQKTGGKTGQHDAQGEEVYCGRLGHHIGSFNYVWRN